jgi:serine/threonine-protein kinase
MSSEMRIRQLLEEILDSGRTPEEVCAQEGDLLPEVRARWERLRRLEGQVDALFPPEHGTHPDNTPPFRDSELPEVAGYEVQAVLGRGGMGVVFKARHHKLNRLVALKMLAGAHAGPQELGRFRREAEAVATLRHPNIVQVYDVGAVVDRPYFTMELIEGGSLAQRLASGPMSVRQAAELVATLACAVQFAHKSGIVHRDLKPANILLMADGTPKIADFGLARSMQAGPEFTLSGTRLGTPSYMAPEQALGRTSAIGPAVDVYALGAILYECLTGQPPFQGESAVETERRVIADEPVPPRRRNPTIPRDLETICLKCLEKNPSRRYASAQDLADDLHRFLDGKPVLARPVGIIERTVKWARRRPATAILLAALVVLLAVSLGIFLWLQQQEQARRTEKGHREERARQAIETALVEANKAGLEQRLPEAGRILKDARNHVVDAGNEDLEARLSRANDAVNFAQQLEQLRQHAAVASVDRYVYGPLDHYQELTTGYRKAFSDADLDIEGDPERLAATIRSAPLGELTVAALDNWAFAAFKLKDDALHRKVLRVAALADPEPTWRDRFRDASVWRDKGRLRKLAEDVSRAARPVPAQQLGITAALLWQQGVKSEGAGLLRKALEDRREDFWLNWEMGNALGSENKHLESAAYFRIVVAFRPGNAWGHTRLAAALVAAGEFDEGIRELRQAIKLARTEDSQSNTLLWENLIQTLISARRTDEAIAECRRIMNHNKENGSVAYMLAYCLHQDALQNGNANESRQRSRLEEAVSWYRKAIDLERKGKVENVRTYCNFGMALGMLGRSEEAEAPFRRTIEIDRKKGEPSVMGHTGLGGILKDLGRHTEAIEEFRWVIRELDPSRKPHEHDLFEGIDRKYIHACNNLVHSLLCLGRFAEARIAAQRALEVSYTDEGPRRTVRRQFEMARQLAPLEARLPAILAGKDTPSDLATQRPLVEWLYTYRRMPGASVRLAESVFAKQAALLEDLDAQERFRAGCAATWAGCGLGEDAAQLTEPERAALRKKGLAWLRADKDAWARRYQSGNTDEQSKAARALQQWEKTDDLAGVRDPARLAGWPEEERRDWENLWAEVRVMASRDPQAPLEQARAYVARKEWARAVEQYARTLEYAPAMDGEVWFEFAAVQLLAGDRPGYRQTCQRMLASLTDSKNRAYLVARACTLAPGSVDDPALPARVSAQELQYYGTAFWSLTEQGALCYRENRDREAVPLLEQSLRTEPRPRSAVLNWLWLALVHHRLGDREEARRWLDRVTSWLDKLGNELPAHGELTMHRHNWLEAHILRQEAELLLKPPRGQP